MRKPYTSAGWWWLEMEANPPPDLNLEMLELG
jgi:hypothetical protein